MIIVENTARDAVFIINRRRFVITEPISSKETVFFFFIMIIVYRYLAVSTECSLVIQDFSYQYDAKRNVVLKARTANTVHDSHAVDRSVFCYKEIIVFVNMSPFIV